MAIFENFPYTNVHELNLDYILKELKKITEEWKQVSTNVEATAHTSQTPTAEVTGNLRTKLVFDFGIPKGDTGPRGLPGPQGPAGTGLYILDTYATLEELQQAHPTGLKGDAYLVGSDNNFTLYIWSTGSNQWVPGGPITSPNPSSTLPLMDGEATQGVLNTYSRGDHVHPSDSSKMSLVSNAVSNHILTTNSNGQAVDSGKLLSQVTNLDLSSVLFFGDSFTEGFGLDNPDTENWATRTATLLRLSKYQRYYCGGAGFVKVSSSHNMNFEQYWDSIKADLNDDITTIFIMGGINDKSYTSNQIVTAINSFNNKIREKFSFNQTKIIYMFNPLPQVCLKDVVTGCYLGAKNVNWVPYDSWYWQTFATSFFQDDYTHPNYSGARDIARKVFTAVRGGDVTNNQTLVINDSLSLVADNRNVIMYVNFTTSTTSRFETIGQLPDFLSLHWNNPSKKGPTRMYLEMCNIADDGRNFGYIKMGANIANVYLMKMQQLGASGWSSGRCLFSNTYDLLELLGG